MVDINKSILNKNNFRLLIDKIPTTEYYIKKCNIPGVQFTEIAQGAGVGLDAYFPGDKVTFENLSVDFLVDEDLGNFKEVYDWMNAIVPIKDPSDYASYVGSKQTTTGTSASLGGTDKEMSDITLITTTNKNIPNKYFRFHDCFPISLSGLEFESGAD
jgi:hypothetical protein